VLDVGCGPGPLEAYLAAHGYKTVDAVDYAEEGLRIAKQQTPQYEYILGDIRGLASLYEGREFDLVFCLQVLEHRPEYMDIVRQIWDLLVKEGLFVISVPWDHCKDNRWHVNHFLPEDFERIAKELGADLMLTERFAEHDNQLLAIMRKVG